MTHWQSQGIEEVDLSIIIVNWNTGRLLEQCIQSIYDTAEGLRIEIFVVDNASSDNSVQIIHSQFPHVRLITSGENLGFSRAANLALAEGVGDCILVAHPDVKFLPGALHDMLSFLSAQPRAGIVGGNLFYPDGRYNSCPVEGRSIRREFLQFGRGSFRSIERILPWLYERLDKTYGSFFWDHQTTAESDAIWNACMMFKREVLEEIGNFCEEFFVWFADIDWCLRAKIAGWKAYYLSSAKVIHYEVQSGDYLNSELTHYKVRWHLIRQAINRDRYTLLRRYNNPTLLWLSKILDTAALCRSGAYHLLWRRNP